MRLVLLYQLRGCQLQFLYIRLIAIQTHKCTLLRDNKPICAFATKFELLHLGSRRPVAGKFLRAHRPKKPYH